ncbi:MAG: PEP-CTERM sorting domain-containing protein [Anaerolineaceae bacterium]|nr:PEP-CTERM sorting domain-containing protein [Anaerolineaceae bacterium]
MKADSNHAVGVGGRFVSCILAAAVFLALAAPALADVVSVKLTTDALGLGSSPINGGHQVDPDMAGKIITSPVTGQGSILAVQRSGLAGSGTALDPLMMTITAATRLSVTSNLPPSHDVQAGVIYLSKENSAQPDGKKEGLGVRAFRVNASGLRRIDSGNGRAKIEGSKHVSGGTGPDTFDPGHPNGAPHVNEIVYFDFDSAYMGLAADSIRVLLSQFEYNSSKPGKQEKIDLRIELRSGAMIDRLFVGPSNDVEGLFVAASSNPGKDKLWMVDFSAIGELAPDDVIESFSISALDDYPKCSYNTAEHFFITGLTGAEIPEPATFGLIAVGLVGMAFSRKRR